MGGCPSIVCWQLPVLHQGCASAKSAPPLTQGNIVPSLCAGNVQCYPTVATAKRAPPLTKGGCISQCCAMRTSLPRAPHLFQGEGSRQHTMDLHFLFCMTTSSFYWITFFPYTNSVAQELCHAYWRSSLPPIVSLSKVRMGGLVMFLSFVWEIYHNLLFCPYLSPQASLFPKLIPWHWQNTAISISRRPLMIVKTVKSKSIAVSRHYPAQPFHPDLVLAIVPGHFFWEPFVANSSVRLLTWEKDWFDVSLIC